MKKEELQLHLNNISNSITAIDRSIEGINQSEFLQQEQVKERVFHYLQEMGEASREVFEYADLSDYDVSLHHLNAFRNARYHQEAERVPMALWSIIKEDLPEIQREVRALVVQLDT